MPSPTHAPTGTAPDRRRLTVEQAMAGALPEPFTDHEWRMLHLASAHGGRWAKVPPPRPSDSNSYVHP